MSTGARTKLVVELMAGLDAAGLAQGAVAVFARLSELAKHAPVGAGEIAAAMVFHLENYRPDAPVPSITASPLPSRRATREAPMSAEIFVSPSERQTGEPINCVALTTEVLGLIATGCPLACTTPPKLEEREKTITAVVEPLT